MKEPIPSKVDFTAVIAHLVKPHMGAILKYAAHCDLVKTATKYISPKLVVRATWRFKPARSHTREELVITYGAPNYLETKFIKDAVKAGEPFPIKKVQLKPWPTPRKKPAAKKAR